MWHPIRELVLRYRLRQRVHELQQEGRAVSIECLLHCHGTPGYDRAIILKSRLNGRIRRMIRRSQRSWFTTRRQMRPLTPKENSGRLGDQLVSEWAQERLDGKAPHLDPKEESRIEREERCFLRAILSMH